MVVQVVAPSTLVGAMNVSEEHAASVFKVKERKHFFEMVITTYQTTWCHNPEDHNLKLHHCENFILHRHLISGISMRMFLFYLKTVSIFSLKCNFTSPLGLSVDFESS
jgi:hypothetical protein